MTRQQRLENAIKKWLINSNIKCQDYEKTAKGIVNHIIQISLGSKLVFEHKQIDIK